MTPPSIRRTPGYGLLVALLTLLLLAACGGSADSRPADGATNGTAKNGEKTVTVAYSVDLPGVNELTSQATAIGTAVLYFALFLQLVEEQADYQDGPPTFLPRLARTYEFSDDRLTLTFYLRDDVVWSDGVPVTAEDVVFTWQAQTSPEVGWSFVESKNRITDVEMRDPLTVVFHFSETSASQLQDANFGVIMPKHVWGELPFDQWRESNDWFRDHLVVNGPFTLESWQPQQRFILRRNERYFEPGLPKVDRIVFQITPDRDSQLALLRSGQAHMVEWIEPSQAEIVLNHPDLELLTHIPRFFYFLQWNVRRPMFADREVRQALAMAIDRQAIIDSLHYGYARIPTSFFPSNLWAHNDDLEPWPYDPGRAKEILARHGWRDTDGDGIVERDGQRFSFELLTNAENQLRQNLVLMIQEQFKRIGVEVRPKALEFNAMLRPLTAHDFDAVVQGLGIDTSLNATYFFHTDGIEGGYNWGAYTNPEVDRLIEATIAEIDPLAAKPLYDRLQAMLHEELPMVYLYESLRLSGVNKTLKDVEPNAVSSFFNMRRWRLETPTTDPR